MKRGLGVDWAEVRRVYEAREIPIRDILARFGLKPHELRSARERGDWLARPSVGEKQETAPRPLSWLGLRDRLLHNLDLQVTALDRRVAARNEIDGTAALVLAELSRGWSYMQDMRPVRHMRAGGAQSEKSRNAPSGAATKKNNKDAGADFRDDFAWIRAELEREILRIRAAAGLEEDAGRGDR